MLRSSKRRRRGESILPSMSCKYPHNCAADIWPSTNPSSESGSLFLPALFFSTNGSCPPSTSVRLKLLTAPGFLLTCPRLPHSSYNMASCVRNNLHANHGPHNNTSRWTEKGCDDWQIISASYCPNWSILQLEFDLRKLNILIPECLLYSNAEGSINTL